MLSGPAEGLSLRPSPSRDHLSDLRRNLPIRIRCEFILNEESAAIVPHVSSILRLRRSHQKCRNRSRHRIDLRLRCS